MLTALYWVCARTLHNDNKVESMLVISWNLSLPLFYSELNCDNAWNPCVPHTPLDPPRRKRNRVRNLTATH